MKFWSDMENLSTVSTDDKLMIGKASNSTACYAEVGKLPFASKSDLIANKVNGIQIGIILVDGINQGETIIGNTYAQYDGSGYWKIWNNEISTIYDNIIHVAIRETGEIHILYPNGINKVIETIDRSKLSELNIGSVSINKITSFISVSGINKSLENETQSTLVYNSEINNWAFRTCSEGNNLTIPLTYNNNNFVVYSQDDNKFYRCQPANPVPQELLVGGRNGFENIIFLGATHIYSCTWSEFKSIVQSTHTYSSLISSELTKVNIGDIVAIPMHISDFNEKTGYIISSVESVNTPDSSLIGKGISYILSSNSQCREIPTIIVEGTVTGVVGTDAKVENVGTEDDIRLKFTIPQGTTGPRGDAGATGEKGDAGVQGEEGTRWFTTTVSTSLTTYTFTISTLTPTSTTPRINDMILSASGYTYKITAVSETSCIGSRDISIKGATGTTGAKGDKGDTGATGEKGDRVKMV